MWITNIFPFRTPLRFATEVRFVISFSWWTTAWYCRKNFFTIQQNASVNGAQKHYLLFVFTSQSKVTESVFVVTSRTHVLNGTKFVCRLLQIHCFQFKLVLVFRNRCESVKRDNNYKTLFVCFVLVLKEKPYPSDNSLKEQRQWFSPFIP